MEIDPKEWLRRDTARWRARKPEMTDAELAELTQDAHEALSTEYPDNPEAAVDDDLDAADGNHMSSFPPPVYRCFGQWRGYCYHCRTRHAADG